MKLAVSEQDLNDLIAKQLNAFFIFEQSEARLLREAINDALRRTEICFSRIANRYYSQDGQTYFSPYHSGQNAIFLYYLSNTIGNMDKECSLSDRIYYLNKCLNSFDLFYQVQMPTVFFADHPVGSVIGRASYGEFFSFSQNCTVGNNHGIYPEIGKHVLMFANSMIIGNSKIGDYVAVSANSYIKDENIPPCSIVFGRSPDLIIKKMPQEYFENMFFD